MQPFIEFINSPVPEQQPTTKQEVLALLDKIWHNQDIDTQAYLALQRMINNMTTGGE